MSLRRILAEEGLLKRASLSKTEATQLRQRLRSQLGEAGLNPSASSGSGGLSTTKGGVDLKVAPAGEGFAVDLKATSSRVNSQLKDFLQGYGYSFTEESVFRYRVSTVP
jgi:hypothetical protein